MIKLNRHGNKHKLKKTQNQRGELNTLAANEDVYQIKNDGENHEPNETNTVYKETKRTERREKSSNACVLNHKWFAFTILFCLVNIICQSLRHFKSIASFCRHLRNFVVCNSKRQQRTQNKKNCFQLQDRMREKKAVKKTNYSNKNECFFATFFSSSIFISSNIIKESKCLQSKVSAHILWLLLNAFKAIPLIYYYIIFVK